GDDEAVERWLALQRGEVHPCRIAGRRNRGSKPCRSGHGGGQRRREYAHAKNVVVHVNSQTVVVAVSSEWPARRGRRSGPAAASRLWPRMAPPLWNHAACVAPGVIGCR